jgi:hypothetical protein
MVEFGQEKKTNENITCYDLTIRIHAMVFFVDDYYFDVSSRDFTIPIEMFPIEMFPTEYRVLLGAISSSFQLFCTFVAVFFSQTC